MKLNFYFSLLIAMFLTVMVKGQVFYGVTSSYSQYGGGTIFSFDAGTGTYTDEYLFKPNPVYDPLVLFEQSSGVYVGVCERSNENSTYDEQEGNSIYTYDLSTGESRILYELPYSFHVQNSGNPPGDIILFDGELIVGIVLLPNDSIGLIRYSLFSNSSEIVAKFNAEVYPDDGVYTYSPSGCFFSAVDDNTIVFNLRKRKGTSDGSVEEGWDFFMFTPQDNSVNVILNVPDSDSFYPYGPFTKTNDGKLFCPGSDDFMELDIDNASYILHFPFSDSYQRNEDGRLIVATDSTLLGIMDWGDSDYLIEYNYVKDNITSSYWLGDDNNINSFDQLGDSIYFSIYSSGKYRIYAYSPGSGEGPQLSYELTLHEEGIIKYLIESDATTYLTALSAGVSVYYPDKKSFMPLVRFGGGDPMEEYAEGAEPQSSLLLASNGKLYGMTSNGGRGTYYYGDGVLFEFDPETKEYSKLVDFTGENGGFGSRDIYGSVYSMQQNTLMEYNGIIYGTTYTNGEPDKAPGYGTVFTYDINASGDNFHKIVDFNDSVDASAGRLLQSGLVPGPDSKLYGTARMGGIGGISGHGVLYSIDPENNNKFDVVMKFPDTCAMYPSGNLVLVSNNKLYGLVENNKASSYYNWQWGIREYDVAAKTFSNLYVSSTDNYERCYSGFLEQNGKLYGMVHSSKNGSYLFEYEIATGVFTVKLALVTTKGYSPMGVLVPGTDGSMWGMTEEGGDNGNGVIFEYNPESDTYTKHFDFDSDFTGYSPMYSGLTLVEGASTGIFNRSGNPELKAYPNPAVDFVKFELGSGSVSEITYSVYDISGREIVKRSVNASGSFIIDLGGLNNGTYIVKVTKDSEVYTQKIIKK
ncbi:MAG: T9SS type A sorting domain-containing protein [Chlorobi bacterium]|nr:T9SS type A sorting domain-containing protein [Chlorobiota bacterium]